MAEQSTKASKNKRRFVLSCALLTVGIALAGIALVCAVGTVAVHYSNVASYKANIERAKSQIATLEAEINNSTYTLHSVAQQKVANMSGQLDQLNNTYQNTGTTSDTKFEQLTNESAVNCDQLTTQLHEMEIDMCTKLSVDIANFSTKLEVLNSDIQNITEQADNFTAMDVLSELEARMKTNVSIYKECKMIEKNTCTIKRRAYAGVAFYWDSCETEKYILPSDTPELIMAMNCKYNSRFTTNYFVGTVLRTNQTDNSSTQSYWCECNVRRLPDVVEPGDAQGEFRFIRIDSGFTANCTLTYIKCPLSQPIR